MKPTYDDARLLKLLLLTERPRKKATASLLDHARLAALFHHPSLLPDLAELRLL